MKVIHRAAIAISCVIFFFALDILWKVFHDVDETDPGVDLRPLLGVVYKKDQL